MPVTAPSGYVAEAPIPTCHLLNQVEAQVAFERLRRALPSTSFEGAKPSQICGLVHIKLASGKSVYTDATGRFLLLTFALDTHRGSPADLEEEFHKAMDDRGKYPEEAIPGLTPPMPVEEGAPLQSLMR